MYVKTEKCGIFVRALCIIFRQEIQAHIFDLLTNCVDREKTLEY